MTRSDITLIIKSNNALNVKHMVISQKHALESQHADNAPKITKQRHAARRSINAQIAVKLTLPGIMRVLEDSRNTKK
jgi:hypothetical protein